MKRIFVTIIIAIQISSGSIAQHPLEHWMDAIDLRYDMAQPKVNYELTVDSVDFAFLAVKMQIKNIRDSFQLAMVRHPEYDDQYWRYIEQISASGKTKKAVVVRQDSALWKIITDGREATITYRIRFPKTDGTRSSWKAYLTSTGGLIGGPHSFMYVVGATLAPSYVTIHIPTGWQIATGLEQTSEPTIFFAPSVFALTDDPIFVGKFKDWQFVMDGTPHRLIYWTTGNAPAPELEMLVRYIKKVIEQSALLFGRLPYRDYVFMLQDGAVGSLEHNNSVTVGAPAAQLENGLSGIISEMTHEYFHTWNLVRIHPVEYSDVSYMDPSLSKGLWFSEGLTIFYADLLSRRASIAVFDTNRLVHLENLIRRYSSNPAYLKFSAENISEASYGPVGFLGDYSAGTHLQGEVLGAMLDLIIRDASGGKRSMDDVMRKMMRDYSGKKGFSSRDVQRVAEQVCNCKLNSFFANHVFGSKGIDFKKYLELIGLKYTIEWQDLRDRGGALVPDLRVFSYRRPGENQLRIGITNPSSCWAKSGLHTGDIIRSINGKEMSSSDFRSLLSRSHIGDQVSVEMERSGVLTKAIVIISSYQQPIVKINQIPNPSQKQRRLLQQWMSGE